MASEILNGYKTHITVTVTVLLMILVAVLRFYGVVTTETAVLLETIILSLGGGGTAAFMRHGVKKSEPRKV